MTKKEKEAQLAEAARQQHLIEEKQKRELGLKEGYPALLGAVNRIREDLGLVTLDELPVGTRTKDPLKLSFLEIAELEREILITPSLWRVFRGEEFEDYLLPLAARDFMRRLFKGEYPQFVDTTRD